MASPKIKHIASFFTVQNVPAALSLYRDRLGFDVLYEAEPDDVCFDIVVRDNAMIFLKDIGVEPTPNYKRDIKKGLARRRRVRLVLRLSPLMSPRAHPNRDRKGAVVQTP